MDIPTLSELAGIEFQNSQIISEDLRNKTIEQEQVGSQQHDEKINENKNNIRNSKQSRHRSILQRLRNDMSDEHQRSNEINQQQGVSTWLTTLPIKEEGYTIKKLLLGSDYGMDGNYSDSQQSGNVGPVLPWTTLFHARKEVS